MTKNPEKTLAERDAEFLRAYINLSRAGEKAAEDLAAGRQVDHEGVLAASSRFRTAVQNRKKAAKKQP